MTTIPIQLNEIDLKKIDYLVKIGLYKNRSQAIKAILQERLAQETILLNSENLEEEHLRKKIVQDLSKIVTFSFKIDSEKSAADLVSEQRERY